MFSIQELYDKANEEHRRHRKPSGESNHGAHRFKFLIAAEALATVLWRQLDESNDRDNIAAHAFSAFRMCICKRDTDDEEVVEEFIDRFLADHKPRPDHKPRRRRVFRADDALTREIGTLNCCLWDMAIAPSQWGHLAAASALALDLALARCKEKAEESKESSDADPLARSLFTEASGTSGTAARA